ncbi:MAG: arsenate reductase ArsC [Deltaproteobacteria bacterium]|nr:arsenate reductase ArsC [Deltaproteobacteria bacterium]
MSKKKILFLCTGNSCRSQMAEAWTRHLWRNLFEVFSAGVAPNRMDPRTVRVMEEEGISMEGHHPKHVDIFKEITFDYVITVCDQARETCPYFPGVHKILHRGFEDPPVLVKGAGSEEEALGHYRKVRDEIKDFILILPRTLGFEDKKND